jgi:hypothetical protein
MEPRDIRSNRRGKGNATMIKIEQDIELLKIIDDLKRKGALNRDIFEKILDEASTVLCKTSLI